MHAALTVSGMWGFEGKTMVAAVDYQLLTELTNLLQVIVLIITTAIAYPRWPRFNTNSDMR